MLGTAKCRHGRDRVAGGVVALAIFVGGAVAAPHHAAAHSAVDPPPSAGTQGTQAPIEASLKPTRGGLLKTTLPDGYRLVTHGADPRPKMNPLDLDGLLPSSAVERPPVCASDNYIHVLYAHLVLSPNAVAANAATIRSSVRQIDALLNAESQASGGISADYKVLCDAAGQIRVDSFVTLGTSLSQVVTSARAQGFSDPRADYLVYVDALHQDCGAGTFQRDTSLSDSNRNNTGGGYAIAYQGCWLDETPMHELAHTQGAVQPDAPNSTGSGGHCNEERDVVCYSPDGGDRNQDGSVSRCQSRITFDCNYDDYFDAAPEPGEYLATHWNLGSPLNRYLAFGQGAQVDPVCESAQCAPTTAPDGSARFGAAASRGRFTYYRVSSRKRIGLEAEIDGPECGGSVCPTNLDLYVRAKKPPTKKRWSCRSVGPAPDESCAAREPRSRVWFLGVRSARVEPGATFGIWSHPASRRKKRG